jgi:hypothetical protein
MRGRKGLEPFLQRGACDTERVDVIGLAALAGALARVGGQVRRDPQGPARRARSETAPTSPTRAGSPRAPTRGRGRACAPTATAPRNRGAQPGRSARRAARRLPRRPRRSCANACECPRRARSLLSSLLSSTENGRLADTACWRRCHASIKSRQTSPTGDERQTQASQALARPTASKRVSSPPVGTLSFASDVTDEPNRNSKPHCDSDDRRARSDREFVCGRRRAYAPDATGRAEWRFCCSSNARARTRATGLPLLAGSATAAR